jgi:DNA-binding transcriptional regulator YhcF (GntR family)
MPPRKLTGGQVHRHIVSHIEKHGQSPSYREIGRHFNVAATTARRYVLELRDRGLIKVLPGFHRGIVMF